MRGLTFAVRSAVAALAMMAGFACGAAELFLWADVPDATVDTCVYDNATAGKHSETPVLVDADRGKPEFGYRGCKVSVADWTPVPQDVSYRVKRSADGAVSDPLSALFPWGPAFTQVALSADGLTPPPPPPPPPPPSPVTIWADASQAVDAGADAAATLGTRFRSRVPGTITAIRFYKFAGNTGAHPARLWAADGTLLASVSFAGETASGWQQQALATPLHIDAGVDYVVGVLAKVGHYASTSGYFSAPFTSGDLTASAGLYVYAAGVKLPTQTFADTNYWVDVVFIRD